MILLLFITYYHPCLLYTSLRAMENRKSIVNFDWLSPYSVGEILKGKKILENLREEMCIRDRLECAKEILNASTTDEAIDILEKYQILQKTMKEILDRIQFYLNHRSYEQILLGAVIFNNTYGYLGQTADAEKLIKLINAQNDEAQLQ